ncbi:MAG: hypothetical protein SFY68_09105 [Candidatus Sumerlaeia bacterium]|nr:hypothetical protein [Candidatus Sumerlaeia bacterium]
MNENTLILNAKRQFAWNALRHLPGHKYIHVAFGLLVMGALLAGGTFIFYKVFEFLMDIGELGPPLMDRLVGIIFLAFFSMLVFSNLVITLATSYISKEVDFLMSQPISHAAVFRQKLIESVIYSSWAFVVLSLPFFLSFGIARQVDFTFYLLVAAIIVPFLMIPAIFGALITMIITAILPAKKTKILVIILAILSLIVSAGMAEILGIRQLFRRLGEENYGEIIRFLSFGSSPLMPSTWLMEGILAIAPGNLGTPNYARYGFFLAVISSTALFLFQISEWVVPKLYYRGWCLTREAANTEDVGLKIWSPLNLVDRLLVVLPIQSRALLSKDLKTFWRDPSQWTQLVMLFGLMIIYITNLRFASEHSENVELLVTKWKTMLAFFNIGATGFILSILTTRFIYPMLSLEGRQFWSIGLAPMPRTKVVWQKYLLCLLITLLLSVVIVIFSSLVLKISFDLFVIAMISALLMSFALSSLTIGIGALMPNFREDNPARIANGLGGTANALISLTYIILAIGMIGIPYHLHSVGTLQTSTVWANWWIPYVLVYLLIQLSAIVLPMWLGLRRWRDVQF